MMAIQMPLAVSPFYANYGFYSQTTWLLENKSKNPTPRNYAQWIESVHNHCLKRLEQTCERMGKYYNKARQEPPLYGVGDLIILNGKQIWKRRAVKKLDTKLFGLFKVKKLVEPEGQLVEFELPLRWRVHNVFHTWLVEAYCSSGHGLHNKPITVTDLGYVNRLGVTHEVDYDVQGNQVLNDFKVKELIESHYNAEENKVLYCIKWKGYPEESEWTEEPKAHLPSALVHVFHISYPRAPIDARLRRYTRGV